MGRTADPHPTGLRERKKLQTRAAISEAADELFEAQGFAATTIPQIAERAQVSPRTVSYYFPVKEELVFPDRGELIAGLAATLDDRGEGETAADALSRWITETFVQQPAEGEERSLRRRAVIDADAGLRAYELELQSHTEEVIAASFARDLKPTRRPSRAADDRRHARRPRLAGPRGRACPTPPRLSGSSTT